MVSFSIQHFLCSFSSFSCGQLAREPAYCGSYSLQSDRTLHSAAFHRVGLCGWACVNVWGGVHHGAGKAPRLPQQHYCHLHKWAFLFLFFFYFVSLFLIKSLSFPPLFSLSLAAGLSPASSTTCEHQDWTTLLVSVMLQSHTSMQQMPRQQELWQLLCGFEKLH